MLIYSLTSFHNTVVKYPWAVKSQSDRTMAEKFRRYTVNIDGSERSETCDVMVANSWITQTNYPLPYQTVSKFTLAFLKKKKEAVSIASLLLHHW